MEAFELGAELGDGLVTDTVVEGGLLSTTATPLSTYPSLRSATTHRSGAGNESSLSEYLDGECI